MAEKDARLAINNAVEQLEQVSAIVQETRQLKSLKPGFRTMKCIVEELEGQEGQENHPDERLLLQQVRDIAYETQDVIGSVVADTNLQRQSKLGRLLSGGKPTKHVEEIENMKGRIQRVCSFKDVASSNKESNHGRSFSMSRNKEVVGFQDAKDKLVRQLMDGAKSKREVILILGKAGSGKTTLARMVCDDDRINEHFGCPVRVSFTQELLLEDKLRIILKRTSSSSSRIDSAYKDELKLQLSETFKGKRYLVVIDNVHSLDAVDEVIASFPDESNQSRILLVSQVTQCDLHGQKRFSYEVKPLDANQSWQLFSSKVLKGGDCSDLEEPGKQMTGKCKGSPGAISALAEILKGVAKTKETWSNFLHGCYGHSDFSSLSEDLKLCWQYFHEEKTEEMWSTFIEGSAEFDDLSEAFELLPEVQQFCLLYFGLIPAGLKIPAKQMIQMWMAEGLLKQKGSKKPEEIGEDYLKKLTSQPFIQVTIDPNGSVKTCSTFRNVYELCQTKGEDWKFFEVHKDNNSKPQKSIKRMAIHSASVTEVLKSFGDCSHVHSLHCFGKTTKFTSIDSAEFWKTLHHNFKNIKVLNLGCLEFDKVPKELGKMTKNLKYLRLNAPNVKNLPPSIVNLHQLETLDMRESPLISLPHGIWKMQFLRHLYLGGSSFLPNTLGIDYYKTLSNLQILSGVKPDKELKWLMVRAKFPNVTKLRICSINVNLTLNFLNSLDHLYHLRSLRVENPIILPNINAFPLNLTKVTLLETKLQPDCIKILGKLPSLRILKLLKDAIDGKEIASEGGFLQLEFLHIENLVVETWKLKSGAMQGVKRFLKGHGIDLKTAPDYLKGVVYPIRDEGNGTC